MGYELTLHAIPKFGTFEEMINTFNYFDWKTNPWNFEVNEATGEAPYSTYEEYWNAMIKPFGSSEEFPGEPSEECQLFYSKFKEIPAFGWLGNWARGEVDDYIVNHLEDEYHENWIIDDLFTTEALEWAISTYKQFDYTPVSPRRSIKQTEDEDSELLTWIDGVEVVDDDGRTYNVYKDSSCLYYCCDDEDVYCYHKLIDMIETAHELLKCDMWVWFSRSY